MPINDCCEEEFARCGTDTNHPIIVLPRENKMTARFSNPAREPHIYYQVDGCLLKNETAADYVIVKEGVGAVVVELKGKDVMSGVEQIIATGRQVRTAWPDRHKGKIAGLLVSVRVPHGAATDLQRARTMFRKEFRSNLQTCNGKKDHLFDDLL